MILHCTLPYRWDIPNPALGYLKGFLEAHHIRVKNVHWNLVFFQEMLRFKRMMEGHPIQPTAPLFYAATLYIFKRLLAENYRNSSKTPLDMFFSLFISKEGGAELVRGAKNKIDMYIQRNDLHKTPLAGFTMKTRQWLMSSYIIRRLKEINPDIKIVIGGLSNETQGRAFVRTFPSVDFAIWGEGEFPLLYLVKALKEDTDLKDVPQLIYREGATICSTQKATECKDLDEYPFADHSDYFEMMQMIMSRMPLRRQALIPIWGSRSCPWNKCRFCVLNEEYSYRTRSPENIVEEIRYQAKKHNNYSFTFVDTELPGNVKRFKTLLKLLADMSADRKEPYSFQGEISPIFINAETSQYMRRASFRSLQVGFEAVTDPLLKKMEKRHGLAYNIQALKIGTQYRLSIEGLNVLKGIPPETPEDILESYANLRFFRFLFKNYSLSPIPLVLYKGSAFYDEVPEEERKYWNYDEFWTEVDSISLIPHADRFEFLGFCNERPHHILWDEFQKALKSYEEHDSSYRWIEYEDGSFFEESGLINAKYVLNRDETDVLIFCDTIKTFQQVKERFSHLKEESILKMLATLKEAGLVYYDEDVRTIISITEAWRRELTLHTL